MQNEQYQRELQMKKKPNTIHLNRIHVFIPIIQTINIAGLHVTILTLQSFTTQQQRIGKKELGH
jgi:hypothetical protein